MRRRDAETQPPTPRLRRSGRARRALGLCDGCGGCGGCGVEALARTLPLVVAFIIAKSDEAIMQLPRANVYDPPRLLRQRA